METNMIEPRPASIMFILAQSIISFIVLTFMGSAMATPANFGTTPVHQEPGCSQHCKDIPMFDDKHISKKPASAKYSHHKASKSAISLKSNLK